MDTGPVVESIFIVVLVLLNGVLAGAEIALVSARRTHLMALADEGNKNAQAALRLLRNTGKFLATIQVGITLAGFFASAFGAISFVRIVSSALEDVPVGLVQELREPISILLVTLVISFITILLGELVPKHLAIRHAEPIALFVARPLEWLATATAPLVGLLTASGNLVLRLLGQGRAIDEQGPTVTEADLRMMFDLAATEGDVEHREVQMLHRVFEFTDRTAREVMTPRPEIEWLDKDDTVADFLATFRDSYHTRFPLCDDTADNVVGIIYTKDIFRSLAANEATPEDQLGSFLRPAYFVPETKRVGALFEEMRDAGQQMALIVDEYGGTAGLVTLKQLVEEIVGRVGDELVGEEKEYETIDQDTFEMDGSMRVDEANEALGLDIPEGDYETLAGFVLSVLGHIPKQGEEFRYEDLSVVVTELRGPKIERVLVKRDAAPELTAGIIRDEGRR